MNDAPGFAHLHNHSTYSLLDGAQRLDEMCQRAAGDGQGAIAVTDHGNLFGALDFAKKAAKAGIRPIFGIEAYVAPASRFDKSAVPSGSGRKHYHHLILLAESYAGYKNLIRLSSAGYLEGFYYRPRIDKDLLARHSEGLVCLSACLAGEIPTLLRSGQAREAERAAGWYREVFGPERYWIELQDHGLVEQAKLNEGAVRLARDLGLGVVATNDCHYLLPEDHFSHEVLVCIQTGQTVNNRGSMTYTPQHYLKTRREMLDLFSWVPESVVNSMAIAERCGFAFERQPLHLPEFPVPAGHDLDSYFVHIAREGLDQRIRELAAEFAAGRRKHVEQEYRDRLEREIAVVTRMGFPGYFLITWDFIRFAREHGIPVGPGRGSAAGSLVAYAMRITDIDPMQYDLLFERFLNPERISMPDIDIDFCFRRREEVIAYVTHKYGRDNVAQIITFGSLAARAVLRDVGRGLEIPYADVDRIAKLVPSTPGQEISLDDALADVPALREAYESDTQVKQMIDVGRRLEGLYRHAGTHAAGVVIAPQPIQEFAPLYRGSREGDEITTQWAKDEIEEIGLLKMDFLGLKTLTLIADCVSSVERETGVRPRLEELPLDDPAVYELFSKARTDGVFQFESEGMKDILRRLRPEKFEDLVALNALYRPGPIGGGLIDEFIKRRHGKVEVEYPHPLLEPILKETYGVIVYQEQVMQIASALAGYSLGEADILRRAMGKKKKEAMHAESERFVARATEGGVAAADAQRVFDLMAFFAGYGFNKSHSAAYALVAYRTAWLKAHHPVHFMAALLTNDKGNTDKLVKYLNQCREMGIRVLPPDVQASDLDFTVENGRILFGLSAIKGVGEGAIEAVLGARREIGRFRSLHELCAAIDSRLMNKRVFEALIQSGALDGLGGRSSLASALDAALEFGQKRRAERHAGQSSLFESGAAEGGSAVPALPEIAEWDERTRLAGEKATLGFYVSGHPLEVHRGLIRDFATHTCAGLRCATPGTEVAVGGILADVRRRKSKKGEWWASAQLEDMDGQVELLVFPKAFRALQEMLENDRALLAEGRLDVDGDRVRIRVDDLCPLEAMKERKADSVQVRLEAAELDDEVVGRLRQAFEAHRGDAQVYLEVVRPGGYRMLARADAGLRVQPSELLTSTLEGVLGPGRVRYRARAAR